MCTCTHARVNIYLRELAKLCIEVADEPRLQPLFLHILALAPGTLAALSAEWPQLRIRAALPSRIA